MNSKYLWTAILASATLPNAARAQDSGEQQSLAQDEGFGQIAEIVVTARKRQETLREVPEAIAAFSNADLETRGIATINDLGRQTPGLSMSERQNHVPNVVLRGVGSYGFVEGVGFYIDDVQNYTDKTMRLEDLERVEVLKGPQGTLFGGSSLGGAIRYVSKRPTFTPSAELKGEVGTENYQSIYASANTPVGDKVAVRASSYYTHDDGFNDDSNLHRSTSEIEEYGVRGQLLFKPSENLSAQITARYRKFDGAYAAYATQTDVEHVDSSTALSFVPNYQSETAGLVGELDYDFGPVELVSLTSFTRQTVDYFLDGDYSPVPAVRGQANGKPGKVYTQEFRLTSTPTERFDWIVGLYGSRRENIGGQVTPLSIVAGPVVISPFVDLESEQTEYAGFGSANVHFGALTLNGGARVMKTVFEQDTLRAQGQPVTTNAHLRVDDTVVLPKVSISYQTDARTLFYASVAEGYEPGKVDHSTVPPQPYGAETDWTYELGVKGDFGANVYYELAAFYIDSRDRQGESIVTIGGSIPTKRVTNIGDASSIGAEASLRWQPIYGLDLSGAIGYLDATWDENAVFNGSSIDGKRVPNTSEWTGNVAATYSVSLSNTLQLGLHADASYQDSFPWQLTYQPISNDNPAYWLASARLSLGNVAETWEVAVRVDNLFDERYFTEFFPEQFGIQNADGTCDNCHLAATGGKRRFILSVGTKF